LDVEVSHRSSLPLSFGHTPLGLAPFALGTHIQRFDVILRAIDRQHRLEHDRELLIDVYRAVLPVPPQHERLRDDGVAVRAPRARRRRLTEHPDDAVTHTRYGRSEAAQGRATHRDATLAAAIAVPRLTHVCGRRTGHV
jgi:hypothetical protein